MRELRSHSAVYPALNSERKRHPLASKDSLLSVYWRLGAGGFWAMAAFVPVRQPLIVQMGRLLCESREILAPGVHWNCGMRRGLRFYCRASFG
jgi:hypothetical protein